MAAEATFRAFVGNISWDTSEDDLTAAFSSFGTVVESQVVRTRTGRSRGFGYVKFSNAEEVANAVAGMHEKDLDGRTLRVEAESPRDPDAPRPARKSRRRQAPADEDEAKDATPSMRAYVGNIPFDTTEEQLREAFASAAGVTNVEVAVHPRSGRPKGLGYVTFDTEENLLAAVEAVNGSTIGEREVRVERERAKRAPRARAARPARAARAAAPAPAPIENNPARVFVGNLSFDLDEEAVRAAFGAVAEVTEVTIVRANNGRPKGFGYVTFASSEAADTAVAALNGTEIDGRAVRVEKENRKAPAPRARRRRRAPAAAAAAPEE